MNEIWVNFNFWVFCDNVIVECYLYKLLWHLFTCSFQGESFHTLRFTLYELFFFMTSSTKLLQKLLEKCKNPFTTSFIGKYYLVNPGLVTNLTRFFTFNPNKAGVFEGCFFWGRGVNLTLSPPPPTPSYFQNYLISIYLYRIVTICLKYVESEKCWHHVISRRHSFFVTR